MAAPKRRPVAKPSSVATIGRVRTEVAASGTHKRRNVEVTRIRTVRSHGCSRPPGCTLAGQTVSGWPAWAGIKRRLW